MATNKPLYIVTGATGAIGRAIVAGLADRGPATIILAVRRVEAAADMAAAMHRDGVDFLPMQLDLASEASVRRFAADVLALGRPVDALINNAGIMPGRISITPDGFESATQVNFVSTRLLTELLLPAFAPGAAIVFTTSITRRLCRIRPDWQTRAETFRGLARRFITYGRSKRMIAAYAGHLQQRRPDLRINCADPWIVDSAMITMGNKVVDRLAAIFFRPLIYPPAQGARAALRAFLNPVGGLIFSPKKSRKNQITYPTYLSETPSGKP